jgi:hypothetical protein
MAENRTAARSKRRSRVRQAVDYNEGMVLRRSYCLPWLLAASATISFLHFHVAYSAQEKPTQPSTNARILLLPRSIVSGERATLAVLDVNGRLAPGVNVLFSNGDHLTTDKTGRALFIAPLSLGVLAASIEGRPGRVSTTVLSAAGNVSTAIEVTSVPKVASLADRFEIQGHAFCGVADANQVTVSGDPALVLASSPTSLVLLPPLDLAPGRASVDISCGKQNGPPLEVVFISLELRADSSPLAPGVRRPLTVQVRGTRGKVELEATNLAPDIAELVGGNPLRAFSTGGSDNLAHYEVIGRKRGNFLISIRLLPAPARPE